MQKEETWRIAKSDSERKLKRSELDQIVRRLKAGPYEGYPRAKDRLFIRHVKLAPSIRQLLVPDGPWCVSNHPNRLNAHDSQQSVDARAIPWHKNAWIDQHGRLIHPHWKQLLSDPRIGLPVGHGFFYRYGPNITIDAAIYRFNKKGKPPEFLLIKRRDNGAWALPGGFVDSTDVTLEAAARREILEETGLGDIGGTSEIIWLECIVGLRTTLHAWTENTLLLFHGSRQYLMDTMPLAGDDAIETGWFTVAATKQKLILLDRHTQYLAKAATVLAHRQIVTSDI